MDFHQFREAVRSYKLLIICSGLAVSSFAFAGSYLLSSYQVTSQVLIRPVTPEPTLPTRPQVGLISPAGLTILQALEESYTTLLTSRGVAERIVQRLHQEGTGEVPATSSWRDAARAMARKVRRTILMVLHLQRPFAEPTPQEKEVQEVQESISGNLIPKSSVLLITVKHRKPEHATRLARLSAETFVEFSREFNAATAVDSRKFLEEQARATREALLAAQAKMDRFRREYGIFLSLDDEGKQRVADLITLESLSRTLESDIRQSQNKIREIRQELEVHPKAVLSSMTTDVNPMIRDFRMQLITLESRLPTLLADFRPKHPQVVALKQQIAELRDRLQSEVQRVLTSELTALNPVHQTLLTSLAVEEITLQGLSARKASVDALLSRVRDELSGLSRNRNTWDLLQQDVKFYSARLDQLMQDLDSARLIEVKKLAEIQVLGVGAAPRFLTLKGLPLLAFPLVGLVIGLVGGGGLAMGLYHFGRSVKDPETTRTRLNLPLYGVIEGETDAGATELHPASDFAWNSYRYARMKLLATSVNGRPLRCLVMATITPDENPARVAARLAAVCAETGARTLLVDCRNRDGGGRALAAGKLPIPDLDILTDEDGDLPPVGDPLRVEKLSTLLRSRRATYDVVFLVAPSLDTSVDAVQLALSPEVDALLLVVWHQRTNLNACHEAKSRLEDMGVRHVGLLYAR